MSDNSVDVEVDNTLLAIERNNSDVECNIMTIVKEKLCNHHVLCMADNNSLLE